MNNKPDFLFVTCANGSEELLAEECVRILGADQGVVAGRGGVMVDESVENAMRLNLRSRIAQRVLWPMVDGDYRDEHDLYELGRRINWSEWITPDETIRVDVTAQRSPLQSLNFAALRIKDAVCDVMRDMAGARPSVDTRFPDLAISLHVDPTHAWIAIDLSGEALFKRGWREQQGEAPLKETLASTLIFAAGWHGRPEDGGLLDPCCGAGTIAIEAAQIACNVAPGLTRRFAFERLRPFLEHAKLWGQMQVEARDTIVKPAVPIWAGDVSFRMTDFATRNAERAGVAHAIDFKTADALQRLAPADRGTIVMNPPYGERIDAKGRGSSQAAELARAPRTFAAPRAHEARDAGERPRGPGADAFARENPEAARRGAREAPQSSGGRESAVVDGGSSGNASEFFAQLAAHWKRNYSGWTAWVLSPDMKLPTAMRLKESRRVPMWNGPIECRLFRFDMVSGSARGGAQVAPPTSH
ncbi:MAG: class I SAM-dependent RNA methyltransferase [Vitreoscilla sp.]